MPAADVEAVWLLAVDTTDDGGCRVHVRPDGEPPTHRPGAPALCGKGTKAKAVADLVGTRVVLAEHAGVVVHAAYAAEAVRPTPAMGRLLRVGQGDHGCTLTLDVKSAEVETVGTFDVCGPAAALVDQVVRLSWAEKRVPAGCESADCDTWIRTKVVVGVSAG